MANDRISKLPLRGKVILKGTMRCETGLHIGASKENLEIGSLDAPVIRDPITRRPYVPGSSLKGKLRSLLERRKDLPFERHGGGGVYRHECVDRACEVCRLFGATSGSSTDASNIPARLAVRDLLLTDASEEKLRGVETGLLYTEWKFENALDRVTAAANPRQLERVPAGSEFDFELVYDVETGDASELQADVENLLDTISLLEDDALGGHGSRGYGKVTFQVVALEGRSVNYYRSKAETDRCEVRPENRTINECRAKVSELLRLFSD